MTATPDPEPEIRTLTRFDEMLDIPRVQRTVWGFADDTGFYPPSLLAFADHGGVVLGAYDRTTNTLVGFTFGFLARHADGRLKLYSQATGVLPAYRAGGLAYRLKCAQRAWALTQGLTLITWTYDPLEMPNARLNIGKLGGIVRRYRRNVYGESFGDLNAGLPTDRFVLEWELDTPHTRTHLDGTYSAPDPDDPTLTPITETAGTGTTRTLVQYHTDSTAPALRLEVTTDLQTVKQHDLALARAWRLAVRELAELYFARGYYVSDFLTARAGLDRRNFYILRREA